MHKRFARVRAPQIVLLILFVISTFTASLAVFSQPVKAATFQMQTGYYLGTGFTHTISGLGFQPDFVLVKSAVGAQSVLKTSSMPTDTTVNLIAAAVSTASFIVLSTDGFTLNGNNGTVNAANTMYTWTAFSGSDCTSSGTFCVGTYTGDATVGRSITTGFTPSYVMNKQSAAAAHFRTASMPANRSDFFTSTASNTAGALISAFTATGFTIGTTANASGGVFYFAAFKSVTGSMTEGSYTGDGTDNRSITAPGFKPDTVIVKNSTSATTNNKRSVMRQNPQPTNAVSYAADGVADFADGIQDFETNGFQLGTHVSGNETGSTFYWVAFKGVPAPSMGSGTFKMAAGTYTGTATARNITGIGFQPDLVIIKDTSTSFAVFTTGLMPPNATTYLSSTTVPTSNIITSLDSDGFSLGTSVTANGGSRTYYWEAFGNAYRPDTKTGASDFAIGAYFPTLTDDTNVPGAPYQLDFLTIKQLSSQIAAFRMADQTGDLSGTFNTAVEGSNIIQSVYPGGFQIGTASTVNVTGTPYVWFGFKNSSNFIASSYTGDGIVNKAVTVNSGMQSNFIMLKHTGGGQPMMRSSSLAGDSTQYTLNAANVAGRIKSITTTGFTVGTDFEVNSSGATYRYMAWRIPVGGVLSSDIVDSGGTTVPSPSFTMNSSGFPYDCSTSTGILGTSSQRIRLTNSTTSPGWSVSIAATDGSTALWRNTGNTQQFDYNDSGGCSDGGDTDSFAGKLRIAPSGATLTPQSGCSTSNVTLGSDQDFDETSLNSITLMSASTGASTNCYWDLTNIQLQQTIPVNQASDSYNINLTLTTIAS